MANKAKWDQIVPNKIVKRLNIVRKMVEHALNQYQGSGTTSGKQIPGR